MGSAIRPKMRGWAQPSIRGLDQFIRHGDEVLAHHKNAERRPCQNLRHNKGKVAVGQVETGQPQRWAP